MTLSSEATNRDVRICTCHPGDNPPVPCPKKYALTECRQAHRDALLTEAWDALELAPSPQMIPQLGLSLLDLWIRYTDWFFKVRTPLIERLRTEQEARIRAAQEGSGG